MSQPFPPPGEYDRPPPQDAQPYGPGPYSQWSYASPREHPQGVTILVLGILSLAVCGLIGPVAWVMGTSALDEIDANPGAYTNRSTVLAGKICGIISTVLMGVGILFGALMFVASSSGS